MLDGHHSTLLEDRIENEKLPARRLEADSECRCPDFCELDHAN